MTRPTTVLLVALAALPLLARGAGPDLDLHVQIDPDSGDFTAQAELTLKSVRPIEIALPDLVLQSAMLDQYPMEDEAAHDGRWSWTPTAEEVGRHLRLAYHAKIARMDAAMSDRDVLGELPAMVSAEGSYFPAGTGWYPAPADTFTYRLTVTSPDGQIAVAPGRPRDSNALPSMRATVFEFPFPSEGIDLMIGPYTVTERAIRIGGKPVVVRTYFHEELQALATGYLDSAVDYLQRYSREIGPYPFTDFSIVSSPLPTGFGMPSVTYLGRQVLKLPFIRSTSLGHEVLHNWWGNGVRVDVSRGNWSEGLTTFMADYAYKEAESAEAAKDMRHGWLRDFETLPPGADKPLSEFRSRHHTASSVIGYGKSAMLFLALRDRLGDDVFNRALRSFWQAQRFHAANFDDLRRAFESASGSDLRAFFDQWLDRTGAPTLKIAQATANPGQIDVELTQDFADYQVRVPVRFDEPTGTRNYTLDLDSLDAHFPVPAGNGASTVTLDPDFRVWRRLAPSEAPPILRDAVAAARLGVLALDADLDAGAMALAHALAEGEVRTAGDDADGSYAPLLVVGSHSAVDAWLALHALPAQPPEVSAEDVRVWAPNSDRHIFIVSLPDAADAARSALDSMARRLPHLARYAWLAFEGDRIVGRGNWPVQSPAVEVRQ